MASGGLAAYLGGMNAHLHEELLDIAKRAGAIVRCGEGHSEFYRAFDGPADRQAYAMANAAFGRGEFPRSNQAEIVAEMKVVLDDANHECPDCAKYRR